MKTYVFEDDVPVDRIIEISMMNLEIRGLFLQEEDCPFRVSCLDLKKNLVVFRRSFGVRIGGRTLGNNLLFIHVKIIPLSGPFSLSYTLPFILTLLSMPCRHSLFLP